VVDFKNTIIIMTSNIGSHIIQENFSKLTDENEDQIIDSTRLEVMDLLKKTIRPEFLNRIDEIIMFTPLNKKEIRDIVGLMFRQVQKMLLKNNIRIEITENAIDKLAALGYDPQFGARPLKRVIQKRVLNELSKMILAGEVSSEKEILIDNDNGNFIFKNE
jgi:ATP-dependent Clp protease ATP-binding subunit ClpB